MKTFNKFLDTIFDSKLGKFLQNPFGAMLFGAMFTFLVILLILLVYKLAK